MSEFDEWFKSLNKNGRVTYFLGQEDKIAKEAWSEQQKKIDAVLKHIDDKCNEFCETHDMDKVALLEEIEELLK